ncbi:PH and SEC7 domain-containing protein isoform X2 [Neocloeon triangulifer]|uniref:PH and SEC7 domain-containing protein isoform X2 n=1 Tax=Neocloeon triangulifer TaxID=2078957 RepID=UPI00286F2B30|nr:PH and SEC7 domain-containing protein isoform X2 [Neocloeon triangulifer]
MDEGVRIVSLRRSDSFGLGFSILGGAGSELPPIIYDIIEDSPAAESGQLEAGDIILEVNRRDVHTCTTKEVLRCLRLSGDEVTLKLKRDPLVKAGVLKYLESPGCSIDDLQTLLDKEQTHKGNNSRAGEKRRSSSPLTSSNNGSYAKLYEDEDEFKNKDHRRQQQHQQENKPPQPRFEAFMMTGDLILNLSRQQQTAGFIPPKQKAVDSLRYHSSVPTSPNEMELGVKTTKEKPEEVACGNSKGNNANMGGCYSSTSGGFVRTSKSEDHLQLQKDSLSAVDIDIDEDTTSSLNNLLDTRQDAESSCSSLATVAQGKDNDRIVWTYNAPLSDLQQQQQLMLLQQQQQHHHQQNSSESNSISPNSPTSVSSSVMSSDNSSSKRVMLLNSMDGEEEDSMDILCAKDLMMELSDPSDSDSTILVSERTAQKRAKVSLQAAATVAQQRRVDHNRIMLQVKGSDRLKPDSPPPSSGNVTPDHVAYQELSEDEAHEDEDKLGSTATKSLSPPSSITEDDSDIESLHSFHYSPKAVDMPSVLRLAKRLFELQGFKKSDVSRHLSKNNDFSRAVAEEYLRFFTFEGDTLDAALRKFLKQFCLAGETQERERVLVHFSKRFLDCNPGAFRSQDSVHTLTCAIMLLNTDLHAQNLGRKMTCLEFIDNLSELNDGDNFPRDVLKLLYQAIKSNPLEWALDEEIDEIQAMQAQNKMQEPSGIGHNPFLDIPDVNTAIEYKKGYVMRKCCVDPNGKKTPFGKRSWKMFYCTLRDMVLYLHKDEHGFRKSQMYDNLHNAIRIHHALATKAADYNKKQHVFRLQTADQAEFLFQTSDSKELQSWIDTINFVAASFSSQPLASAVGSQRKFQRPLLPCSHSKLNLREQLRDHEERVALLENELDEHRRHVPERGAKSLSIQNHREKDAFLQYELKRYKTYAYLLRSKMAQYPELEPSLVETSIGEVDERVDCDMGGSIVPPPIPERPVPRSNPTNRTNQEKAKQKPLSSQV